MTTPARFMALLETALRWRFMLPERGRALRPCLGLSIERKQYLYTEAPLRNRRYAEELQEMYGGRCQICQWNPLEIYGFNLCHAHHIQWLSRGGKDGIENMMLVCPNHHGAIHRGDAPLDFGSQAFLFDQHSEKITLNHHLEF